MRKLDGKVALITGCSKEHGFGRAIARRLSADGATIVLTDISEQGTADGDLAYSKKWKGLIAVAAEIRETGGRVLSETLDVCSASQVETVFTNVVKTVGGLDILVNNAAAPLGQDRLPVAQVSEAAWDVVIDTNLKGTFLCSKAAAALMMERKRGGRIVNVSSDLGKVGMANRAAYCASKFGIIGFTQALAMELAQSGITANSICPGLGATDRLHHLGLRSAGSRDSQRGVKMMAEESARIPLGRLVSPDEVAAVVAFLASDDAAYITGQAINISGGLVMH